MSKPVIRGGSVAVQPFAMSLRDVAKLPRQPAPERQTPAEKAKKEGHAAGYADGFAAGREAGYEEGARQAYEEAMAKEKKRLKQFTSELQKVHDGLQEAIADWFERSERELEAVAVEVAEQLIDAQLQLDRGFIVESSREAMRRLSEAGQARIRVNPFDSAILAAAKDQLLAATANLRGIEIVDDDSIRGGCFIESDRGVVDATLDTRLADFHAHLEEAA